MQQNNRWEIKEKLSHNELVAKLKEIQNIYGDKYYRHTNDQIYFVSIATVINNNGTSHWGVMYHPVNIFTDDIVYAIPHTRPLYEFLDGRFKEINVQ